MAENARTYRLLTRADFDGVVCAALLRERGLVDRVEFVDPRAMQHGEVAVSAGDITANLPYVPGVHLGFDHHASEVVRVRGRSADNFINDPGAPSALTKRFAESADSPPFNSQPKFVVGSFTQFWMSEIT